jgi:hypothetical protein
LVPQPSDFKNKNKIEPWRNSKPNHFLLDYSETSSHIQGLTPEEAWESSEWFKKYPKDRFVSNMKSLKSLLIQEQEGGYCCKG